MDVRHRGRTATLWAFTAGCLIGMTMPALAQDAMKSPAKWRPKDGSYVYNHEEPDEGCKILADVLIELRKKLVIGNELFNCKVLRLTDVTESAIRLDLSCREPDLDEDDDPAHARNYKEVMTLRKIDKKTLFMNITKNGKFNLPESKLSYCGQAAEGR